MISQNTGFITYSGSSGLRLPQLTFAHEVGHSLGASHDGDGNSCPPSGFLMASMSSGPETGEMNFSNCSLRSIDGVLGELSQDPRRQCLVLEEQEDQTTLFIILGVSPVLLLSIVLLLYCLYNRDRSPRHADFGLRRSFKTRSENPRVQPPQPPQPPVRNNPSSPPRVQPPPVSGPLTGTACVQTLKDKQLKLTKLESLLVANRHVFLNPFKTSQDFYLFC